MKQLLVIVFMSVPVAALLAQQTESQKALLEMELQRATAIANHDAAFLTNLYDDAYWGVTSSGEISHKAEQLDTYKNRNTHVVFSNEDVQVTVYGNSAVVTGKQVTKSKAGSTLGQTRYLLVYSKLSDQWKIVMGQETDVILK